jgi:hypothetical protein
MDGPAVTATRFDCNVYNKETDAPLKFYACVVDVMRIVRLEFVFVKLHRQIVRNILTCAQPNFTALARQVASGHSFLTLARMSVKCAKQGIDKMMRRE